MSEVWKKIKESSNYEISSKGRVRSTGLFAWSVKSCEQCVPRPSPARNKDGILKFRMGGYKKKYCRVQLRFNGVAKDYYVHRLVLQTFVGEPPTEKHQASHKDGNPLNNDLENLCWELPLVNSRRKIDHGTSGKGEKNTQAKLKPSDIDFIIVAYATGMPPNFIAYVCQITLGTISDIISNRTWKHIERDPKIQMLCLARSRINMRYSERMNKLGNELIREF